MTNIQTTKALSDAELDNVAGGFNFGIFKLEVQALAVNARHPIDNARMIVNIGKGMLNNFLGRLD
jgi:hypothetical protein